MWVPRGHVPNEVSQTRSRMLGCWEPVPLAPELSMWGQIQTLVLLYPEKQGLALVGDQKGES